MDNQPEPDEEVGPLTLAFLGTTTSDRAAAARAYEDDVLKLIPQHGGQVVFRGHRRSNQSAELPTEVHILRFPSRTAFRSYLDDPRRASLLAEHGEVFDETTVVEIDHLT